MRFSRQEYWSGLPLPSPGDLPNPEIEPMSPALQTDSIPLSHQGSPFSPLVILVVSVSCGCVTYHYKQSLIVLEARSVKSMSLGQNQGVTGPSCSGGFRERFVPCLFQLLVAADLPCLWWHHSNLCLHLHITFAMSLSNICLLLFYKNVCDGI